jgi:CHAT domain-containing protein/tetratricopeptide (TPR) repeat protein
MLRRLVKLLNKIFQQFFGKRKKRSSGFVTQQTATQPPPELTNADLEYLFTQLLEGVNQARGQQWAINYLRRMENRISEQRWIDWLNLFGGRLLSSAAPNDELAFRMVQLGELEIGTVGEFAYEIGMQLLARHSVNVEVPEEHDDFAVIDSSNSSLSNRDFVNPYNNQTGAGLLPFPDTNQQDWFLPEVSHSETSEQQQDLFEFEENLQTPTIEPAPELVIVNYLDENNTESLQDETADTEVYEVLVDSPGQELLREFGEDLWDSVWDSISQETPVEVKSNEVEVFVSAEEPLREFTVLPDSQVEAISSEINSEQVETVSFEPDSEQVSDGEEWVKIIDENYVEFFAPEASIEVPLPPRITPGQELVANLGESLWEFDANDSEPVKPVEQPQLQNFITSNVENIDNTVEKQVEEEVVEQLVEEQIELEVNNFEEPQPETTVVSPVISVTPETVQAATDHWDRTLANVSPTVAVTLDELWVRLQQSANLVEQLASGFLTQANTSQIVIQTAPNQASSQAQAQAWYYQGLQQTKSGDLVGAIASYDQAIGLAPDAYEYWFNRGLALFHLQNLPQAIASYENAIAIKPDYFKAWFNRGASLGELERYEEAIISFDKAIEIKADYDEAWSGRGLALLKLQKITEAISSYDRATQLNPEDGENWYYRGVALLEKEQYAEAITSFDEALEIQPQNYLTWYYRGVSQARLERWEEAVISYQKALKSQPGSYELWYLRGVALDKIGRQDDAIDSFNNALELNWQHYNIWIDKGVIEASRKQWAEAISSWDNALAINPNLYLAWFNKAIAWENLQERENAIASYDQAVTIEPNFHLAWYNRGLLLVAQHSWEAAILSFDCALQIQPDYWEAWVARANAAEKSPEFDFYLSSYSAIASNNPAVNARGSDGKIATYIEAAKYINKDTNLATWGRLYLALGNAYYDRGKGYAFISDDWSQAINAYNHALESLLYDTYPDLHLEVVQSIIKVLLGFGDTKQAQQFHSYGANLLANSLNDANIADDTKKQQALKFAGFGQLAVDISVQCGELVQALEIAEYGKNACLNWLLYGWNKNISSPSYETIQRLVNPTTAIVYWHISPFGLRSFIIKLNHPEPILVFTPIFNIGEMDELPIPEPVERLITFEDWVNNWQEEYEEYCNLAVEEVSQSEHTWQQGMEKRLQQLREILNIPAIERELEGISKLILIPHRNLFQYPIHALFQIASPESEEIPHVQQKFTISYLPTAEIGLSYAFQSSLQSNEDALLSIEAPNTTDYPSLQSTKLESEAITQMFDKVKRIQGVKASKQEVEAALVDNYNILHFTGHVVDNIRNPQQSELLLTKADKLIAGEINSETLAKYNLVTFSAGETEIVNAQAITTEYANLVNAFMKQGVNHIVSSQWTVESVANALVMIEFYRLVKQGKPAATALNEATTWLKELTAGELKKWYENLLRKSPLGGARIQAHVAAQLYKSSHISPETKLYNHPYYWAAFKITGK